VERVENQAEEKFPLMIINSFNEFIYKILFKLEQAHASARML
jgi:hypothetical protein